MCAGLFCNDACLCQDCENRTDTLSAVFKARQFIMVKDPAAFKPKVGHPMVSTHGHQEKLYGSTSLSISPDWTQRHLNSQESLSASVESLPHDTYCSGSQYYVQMHDAFVISNVPCEEVAIRAGTKANNGTESM